MSPNSPIFRGFAEPFPKPVEGGEVFLRESPPSGSLRHFDRLNDRREPPPASTARTTKEGNFGDAEITLNS